MRRLGRMLLLGTVLALVGAVIFREQLIRLLGVAESIALRSRQESQWRALDVAVRSLEGREAWASWAGGLFLGREPMNAVLRQLNGHRIEYTGADARLQGTFLEIQSVEFEPRQGFGEAQVMALASKGDISVGVRLVTAVTAQRIVASDLASAELVLRFDPLELQQSLTWRSLSVGLKRAWSTVVPDLAEALARSDLFEVRLPLNDTLRMSLGVDRTETVVVNPSTNASITYHAAMPTTLLEQRVSASVPLFTSNGVWLLGRLASDGQALLAPGTPPATDELPGAIEDLQQKLHSAARAFGGDDSQLTVRVSKTTFDGIGDRVSTLSDANRTLTIQVTDRAGEVAKGDWNAGLLGNGGYYGYVVPGDGSRAAIRLSNLKTAWDAEGLHLELTGRAIGKMKAHLHFDPVVGGGAGTDVDIDLAGEATLRGDAQPGLLRTARGRAVVARVAVACSAMQVRADTAVFPVDLGWIKAPSVGARTALPVGGESLSSLSLIDNRPFLVEWPSSEAHGWRHVPAHRAVRVALSPSRAGADADGLIAEASLDLDPTDYDGTQEAGDNARRRIADEGAAITEELGVALSAEKAKQDCQADRALVLTIGGVEAGPGNAVANWVNQFKDTLKKTLLPKELSSVLDQIEKHQPEIQIGGTTVKLPAAPSLPQLPPSPVPLPVPVPRLPTPSNPLPVDIPGFPGD